MAGSSWRISEVAWPADPVTAAAEFAARGELAWLDSAADICPQMRGARHSVICSGPVALLEQWDGRPAELAVRGRQYARADSGWRLWRRFSRELPRLPLLPWSVSPGWVGYIGFEMVRQLERLPASRAVDTGLPLMRLSLFDRAIVLDHRRCQAWAVQGYLPGLSEGHDPDWLCRWHEAAGACRAPGSERARDLGVRFELSQSHYQQAVERALEYIRAGDIYQVNLAQRLRIDGMSDPLAAYAAVRGANPAPHSAFLCWKDGAVASVSPELFLRLRAGSVLTSPIKGTRPRTGNPQLDRCNRRDLWTSAKEAAELAMIVDLHRNDLGRVCRYGSVQVRAARRLEAHPTVYHTVADITGELAVGRDAFDLLEACFPAGSVTGVPKIRAIQIIDELEPVARGVYTGAIGFLGLDGQMTFNVAIRTLQIAAGEATLYVGGGIVADSRPEDEYAETLAKARGILRGLIGVAGTGSDFAVSRSGAEDDTGVGLPERAAAAG